MTTTKPFLPDAIVDMAVAAIERGEYSVCRDGGLNYGQYNVKIRANSYDARLKFCTYLDFLPAINNSHYIVTLGNADFSMNREQADRLMTAIILTENQEEEKKVIENNTKARSILERLGVK